ncbi:hypothetical protein GWA97_00785 [Flavobacterium sp. LaA7.5]|nr:hypothetical protein [Flavobacterium salilacus subsp. altitudinum]
MKKYVTLIVLLICFCSLAQSLQNQSNLSARALEAYKQKAEDKVSEFYNYVELLTNPALNSKMKEHTANEALKLFETSQTITYNIFNKRETNPTITQLLNDAARQKKQYHFKITAITATPQYQNTEREKWLIVYTLTINSTKEIRLQQFFIIVQEDKKFGDSIKQVRNTYLGKITIF